MLKTTLKSTKTKKNPHLFWHSINIFMNKQHVINKRLWGSKIMLRLFCQPVDDSRWNIPNKFNRFDNKVTLEEFLHNALKRTGLVECSESNIEVILTQLYPKIVSQCQVLQLILIDKQNVVVTFYDVSQEISKQKISPSYPFSLGLKGEDIELTAYYDVGDTDKSYQWLCNTLLPQVIKWCDEDPNINQSLCKASLSLVSQNKYYARYNNLKEKFGKEMVKIWPECTDPSKFVYEDIAIATYLLLLWEDEETCSRKQTFVDLGCGNGLLVYILTMEGHTGVGIDVRKRNIWDFYPKEVILEERTIVPSDSSLFPETDWLIGNHSDELTPWIPVIAAKSSYSCNFFLLPCCAYNFDGTKYQRKNSCKSQYIDFLEHIRELTEDCGFNVNIDRLKIPSTKRICLVSKGRSYSEEKYEEYCNKIQNIIANDTSAEKNDAWVKDFKPREAVEKVRNCTQIDKDLIKSIVQSIANHLLDGHIKHSTWYSGKTVELGDLIQLISCDQLKQLKSECGGIQTLLKNNHSIFKVQNGKVQLRYPQTIDEVLKKSKSRNLKVKQKPCWFYENHPQGCPLPDAKCSFLHVKKMYVCK